MASDLVEFFQDLQKRGLIANYANLDNFYKLKPEEKVVYLGIDCTAESLHIGHLFLLIQTIRFAHQGFQVLLVLGGATSKIGDPSDKVKERTQLEVRKLVEYQTKIKEQLQKILSCHSPRREARGKSISMRMNQSLRCTASARRALRSRTPSWSHSRCYNPASCRRAYLLRWNP